MTEKHEAKRSSAPAPETGATVVSVADYIANSAAVMTQAMDREVVVVDAKGNIAAIIAGKVEPLK